MENIIEKIEIISRFRGLNQAEIANKIFMSKSGFNKIMKGESRLDIQRLEQIANVLGFSLQGFINYEIGTPLPPPINGENDNNVNEPALDYKGENYWKKKVYQEIQELKNKINGYQKELSELTEKIQSDEFNSHSKLG